MLTINLSPKALSKPLATTIANIFTRPIQLIGAPQIKPSQATIRSALIRGVSFNEPLTDKSVLLMRQKNSVDTFCAKLSKINPAVKVELVRRAGYFASEQFIDDIRKDKRPFFTHFQGVANLLLEIGVCRAKTLAAAYLHDYFEDKFKNKEITQSDIDHLINILAPSGEEEIKDAREIIKIVDAVSKLRYGDHPVEVTLKHLLEVSENDIRPLLLKIADRLYNQEDWKSVPLETRRTKSQETREIYAPLAERLGLWDWRSRLYDTTVRDLEPELYQRIKLQRENLLLSPALQTASILKDMYDMPELKNAQIVRSPRCVWDIIQMAKRRGSQENDISATPNDVLSFAIILDTPNPQAAFSTMGALSSKFKLIPGTLEDAINIPRANGYRALFCYFSTDEGTDILRVQIQTREMYEQSNRGIALSCLTDNHWYKAGTMLIHAILELAQELGVNDEGIRPLVSSVARSIHVKTPQARWVDVPIINDKIPTIVDFAAYTKSDFPGRLLGAKVNGAKKPLNFPLKNGDTIYLELEPPGKTHYDPRYFAFAQTPTAKKLLKESYKGLDRNNLVEGGKQLIKELLLPLYLTPEDLPRFSIVQSFCYKSWAHFTKPMKDDILKSMLGKGWEKLFDENTTAVLNKFGSPRGIIPKRKGDKGTKAAESSKAPEGTEDAQDSKEKETPIKVQIEDIYYLIGVGMLQSDIVLTDFLNFYKRKNLDTKKRLEKRGESTSVQFIIKGEDREGILRHVIAPFGALQINIDKHSALTKKLRSGKKYFRFIFRFEVLNEITLFQIIRVLEKLKADSYIIGYEQKLPKPVVK